jgi:Zn-dependent M28 family amino/carboxypeptidase
MESDFQPFSGKVSSRNTIGRISGTTLPKEFYLITAHMDSISPQASIKAPGADDNGTGTALLMEAARVFKACNFPLKRSVELVGFSGEEQYLVGSYYYVHNLPSQQVKNIKGVINIDMVGNDKDKYGKAKGDCVSFGYQGGDGGSRIAQKAKEVSNRYSIPGITVKQTSISASDHGAFWGYKGYRIPAIFATECTFNTTNYHKITDTRDTLNYRQFANATKTIIATIAQLANE